MPENIVTTLFTLPVSHVTLHEPIFVDFLIYNELAETIQFDLGHNRKSNFVFTIIQPDGAVITLPRLSTEGIGRIGRLSLEPRNRYVQRLLLNEWHHFISLGNYQIQAQLLNSIQTQSGIPIHPKPSDPLSLHIHCRDPERLQQICQTLAHVAIQSNVVLEATEAALALSYIQDPIAIPFLEQELKQGKFVQSYAIYGLGRIANAEAIALLLSTARHGEQEIASLARFVLYELKEKTQDSTLKDRIQAGLQF
jgi:PBS lyase HEAT-like repeat